VAASVLNTSVPTTNFERAEIVQKCVDTAVTLPQYLVLTGEPIPSVGLHRITGESAQPKTPCKGKKFTEENTSWQPRKRLQRRKRNTNRLRDDTSQWAQRIQREASREKHLLRGFL